MKITPDLIDSSKYDLKCPYTMTPKLICIHETANDASAKNEISYMKSNSDSTSFHIAVDDVEARQGIPFNRNAWHCGDGLNGLGNRNAIAIEICYSKSGGAKYDKAVANSIEVVKQLMKEYNIPLENVRTHQSFSPEKKNCPTRILASGWDKYLAKLKSASTVSNVCPTCGQKLPGDLLYQVCKGDTLSHIAKAYAVKVDDLMKWNNLKDPNKISVGQILKIKG